MIFFVIYSKYKISIKINKNFKINKIIIIIIKKIYYKNYFKKNIFFLKFHFSKKIRNFILLNHFCVKKKIIHCIKHFLNKNHNSIIEKKINEIF